MKSRTNFSQQIKNRVLLWCNRHCCLCGKDCGTDIEVHHVIEPKYGGTNNIDNAFPLCYDCHSLVSKYNLGHPRGNKYQVKELKARREEIFDKYTSDLIPQISYEVTQLLRSGHTRTLPNVGFNIKNNDNSLPVKAKVFIEPFLGGKSLGIFSKGHYSGKRIWNLNPGQGTNGHFWLPKKVENNRKRIEVKVSVSLIDRYGREHKRFPVSWVYMRQFNQWYFNP